MEYADCKLESGNHPAGYQIWGKDKRVNVYLHKIVDTLEELYETPFIDYHFMGVEGLYTEVELNKLFEKITNVNSSVLI